MTLRIELSPRAQADMDSIWDYTVGRWGNEQAAQYTRDIAATVGRIAENPLIGSDQSHMKAGYWKIRSGSHSIYYLCALNKLEVVRILHGGMNARDAL